jgi:multiple sugar transport system substrate-binding protein
MARELTRREFMRRIGAGGVIVVGGASIPAFLAACAGPTAPAGSQSPSGPIAFLTPPWGVTDPDKQKAWEAKSNIQVTTTAVPNEQVYQKVQLGLTSNSYVADVIFESEEAPSYEVAAGALIPLDDYIAKEAATFNADKITNFAEPDFKKDGKIVGITAYIQNTMFDYNAKKLEAAGFKEPPKTWDEFRAQALAVKAKGIEKYPVALAAIFWSWFPIAMSMGDVMFDDKAEPTFNAPNSGGRKAMAFLIDLFDKELISPDLVNAVDPHSSFLGGIGTFHQSWLGAHAVMNNPKVSKQAPDVRYMLLPEQHWTSLGDSAIGISKHAKNPAAAWEFVKYYMSEENQRHLFDAFGLVPSLKSVVAQINAEGKNSQPDVQEEQNKYLRPLPRTAKFWGPWTTAMNETIKRAFLHQVTPDAAVDEIAAKWHELKSTAA